MSSPTSTAEWAVDRIVSSDALRLVWRPCARASRYVRIYGSSDRTAKCGGCYRDDREEMEMGY